MTQSLPTRRSSDLRGSRRMKFTLGWLKDHLETEASLDDIVAALTRVGLEVEGVEDPAAKLGAFTIARVLTAERHPQADKLRSEEHTSELQSLMRISYDVFCLKKKKETSYKR